MTRPETKDSSWLLIPVRVRRDTHAEIVRVAAELGMTRSDYIRQTVERAVKQDTV